MPADVLVFMIPEVYCVCEGGGCCRSIFEKVLLCGTGRPQTLSNPPASASGVLGWQGSITISGVPLFL